MVEHVKEKVEEKPRNMMDYTFMSKYQPDNGFKFCVDGLNKMAEGGFMSSTPFYKVLYLLSPPALFYQDPPMTEDIQFTREYDLKSEQGAPKFNDGYFKYAGVPDDESLSIIMEIRHVSMVKKAWTVSEQDKSLWSVLPIFRSSGYVDSGCFLLPVFSGKVPQKLLEESDPYAWICGELGKKAKEKPAASLVAGGSVVVRLSDCLVEEFEGVVKNNNVVDRKYVYRVVKAAGSKVNVGQYGYDPAAPDCKEKKSVGKLVKGGGTLKDLNVRLAEATSITHYLFD
jgi:hypothetical protein